MAMMVPAAVMMRPARRPCIHANHAHIFWPNYPVLVLGFWDENTGICAGAMLNRRDLPATTRIWAFQAFKSMILPAVLLLLVTNIFKAPDFCIKDILSIAGTYGTTCYTQAKPFFWTSKVFTCCFWTRLNNAKNWPCVHQGGHQGPSYWSLSMPRTCGRANFIMPLR